MAEEKDDVINQVFFEKFKATKRLGNGSFGVVYQGINTKTQEHVALKLVRLFYLF